MNFLLLAILLATPAPAINTEGTPESVHIEDRRHDENSPPYRVDVIKFVEAGAKTGQVASILGLDMNCEKVKAFAPSFREIAAEFHGKNAPRDLHADASLELDEADRKVIGGANICAKSISALKSITTAKQKKVQEIKRALVTHYQPVYEKARKLSYEARNANLLDCRVFPELQHPLQDEVQNLPNPLKRKIPAGIPPESPTWFKTYMSLEADNVVDRFERVSRHIRQQEAFLKKIQERLNQVTASGGDCENLN
jgi:hypothetical protein